MEDEVREILRNAVNRPQPASRGLGSEIALLFRKNGIEFELPEFRGHTVIPPKFEE
jgi:plasmid stability protein